MKKIILSVAVAAMALSTTASALEDIKVSGQAKLWYETTDAGTYVDQGTGATVDKKLFASEGASGEVVFKLAVTGKQGNVGFGATMYQSSTMGLQGVVVGNARNYTTDATYIGEAYITAPMVADTTLKFGKQELDTPMAFTERWNSLPNTFNAALAINSSVDNLTLIGGYIGEGARGELSITDQFFGTAYALAGLYKTDAFGVNLWAYQINSVGGATTNTTYYERNGGQSVNAYWADASMKAGPVALKAYAALVDGDAANTDATTAFALSVAGKAGPVSLFAAASTLSEGSFTVGNTATGYKKTKLPTAGVYTDGKYVAQPGANAFKIKASGKAGTTGLALQAVMNSNSNADGVVTGSGNAYSTTAETQETTEVDLIVTQKLGDFNLKGILMQRTFADSATDDAAGGIYARVIASVNF